MFLRHTVISITHNIKGSETFQGKENLLTSNKKNDKNEQGKRKQLFYVAAANISSFSSVLEMATRFHNVHTADPLRHLAQWLSGSPLRGPECQSAELPHTQTVATSDAALISQPSRVAKPPQWNLCKIELLKKKEEELHLLCRGANTQVQFSIHFVTLWLGNQRSHQY